MNIFLKFSYDGTNYSGFQIQKNAVSIQEKIEQALFKIYNKEIRIKMASRTDKGVHALGQCAIFKVDDIIIPSFKLPQIINRYLPKDIVCHHAEEIDEGFHPRFHAKEKIYEYTILNNSYPIPQYRNLSHFHRKFLDVEKMIIAADYFLGTHDFVAFKTEGSFVKSTIRTIKEIKVWEEKPFIKIRVRGDGFMYNMIRIMAGTLIDVGACKIEPEDIEKIILSENRKNAGITAEAGGLTLVEIIY